MTILNASASDEAVHVTLVSDQFAFASRDPGGVNSFTDYSYLTSAGDDVQVTGSGIDFNGSPPNAGLATQIDIDLSNDSFSNPDVEITNITRANAGGALAGARLSVITDGALDFFNEVMAFDDTMIGSALDDVFKGGGGADELAMGAGDDTAYGDAGDDILNGEDGEDTLNGGSGNDVLRGGDGDDLLNGGTGADNMNGGFGNDAYVVDDVADVAGEVAGGVDRVDASVTHALSANIENLTLTGTAAISGTGNARSNVVTGNAGNNSLFGQGGNDTLSGGSGGDVLNGGTGSDAMSGGAASDTYVVDNAGDVVIEAAGAGTDLVSSSVTHTLAANVENLTLTIGAAINGTGNGAANIITGNTSVNVLLGLGAADTLIGNVGADTLNGGSGADVLRGGSGADILIGGANNDVFDFNAVSESAFAGVDVINGFSAPGGGAGDRIDLSTIDATTSSATNDAFVFAGVIQNPFPPVTAAGTVWLRNEGGETVVYANTDGDAAEEMEIRIADGATDASAYSAADFIL